MALCMLTPLVLRISFVSIPDSVLSTKKQWLDSPILLILGGSSHLKAKLWIFGAESTTNKARAANRGVGPMKQWIGLLIISFITGCAGSNGGISTTGGRGPVPDRTDPFYPSDMEASDDNAGETDGQQNPTAPSTDPIATGGACDNSADEAAIADLSTGDNEALNDCVENCLFATVSEEETLSGCYSDCLVEQSQVSSACATCFGDVVECEFESCMDCDSREEGDACMQTNCAPDFEDCAGIALPD